MPEKLVPMPEEAQALFDDVLLTPAEAGRILGLTSDGVRALSNKGRLQVLKTLTGRRLFLRSDVERLAGSRALLRKVAP